MNQKRKSSDTVKIPNNVPVPVFLQEAELLLQMSDAEVEKLCSAGFNKEILNAIPLLCRNLSEAEAVWNTRRKSQTKSEKSYKSQREKAFTLRHDLVRTFRFAIEDNPAVIKQLTNMTRDHSVPGLIQHLSDLSSLGKSSIQSLEKINFDTALLNEASSLSDSLAEHYAAAISDRAKIKNYLTQRNIAYTQLKEAVDEVKRFGKFVFKDDKKMLRIFSSEHRRKQNRALREKLKKES